MFTSRPTIFIPFLRMLLCKADVTLCRHDQSVDVTLSRHAEPYKQPTKVYKPFGGSGNRLGSPTPGGAGPSGFSMPDTAPPAAAPAASAAPDTQVDPSQPTLSLRIQLANGTRLPARFNTTQTIGDVYGFIAQASPE
jgi:UBX domain-containing protein 1